MMKKVATLIYKYDAEVNSLIGALLEWLISYPSFGLGCGLNANG